MRAIASLAALALLAPSGRLSLPRARAVVGGSGAIDDALSRGRVIVWQPSGARPSAGAVGAGWRSDEAPSHVDPATVVLVGTSHIVGTAQSAALVRDVILAVRPDAVIVELCRSRRALLYPPPAAAPSRAPNPFGVSGARGEAWFAAVRRSLELGGPTSLALRLLLARAASATLDASGAPGGGLGAVAYGADFVAAREAAEHVDAMVVLGDRPIEITLERAWDAMSLRERARLLAFGLALVAGARAPAARDGGAARAAQRADAVDAATERAGVLDVECMAALLVAQFPSLHRTLVVERDVYLSLTARSSRAVSGARCVVAVVGAGHIEGVVRALDEEHRGQFKALTSTPRRARAKLRVWGAPAPLVDRLVRDCAIGLGLYAATALWNGPSA
ncbi:hypothetical protein KFE25_012322 [Diacronema lutheri]|uniref:TraB domain-containing protein n=1 Tax=Diacronema lutheri TaxID=2081491 RepID=A0A8J5XQU6_DIALT|nr:hypothetical protein KFE25_012322 [Diacronema lutheri]